MNRAASAGLALCCAFFSFAPLLAAPHPVSVDDLMKLRWIADVQISPDGKRVAYIAPDPTPADEERRKKDNTYVNEVDRNERPPRVWIQDVAGGDARAITPADQYVLGLSWSPDSSTLAYTASNVGGFNSQYHSKIYSVPAAGGASKAIVDRPGMNRSPAYSPDGRSIAFVSTGGTSEMRSDWGLHVVPTTGGAPR